ncbi:MAG: VWA domain-containing protein [Deltaproteobacteria bacterium]|nr:VWA domain-containing protein [Deltaproteobacteria bacterium]
MQRANLSLLLLSVASACTSADFYFPVDPDSPQTRVELKAEVCAPPPVVEDAPYKILFVVDTSLSNIFSDVAENRVAAYNEAIRKFGDKESVSFALITFNDQPHLPVLAFTRDQGILGVISKHITAEYAEGGTNYSDTLAAIYNFINNDINSTLVSDQAPLVAKTHYLVYWLSDGLPTFGVSDPVALASNAQTIYDYLTPKVAEFKLHTLYMRPPLSMDIGARHWEITASEIAEAQALLELMAQNGGGTFTPINTGAAFGFDIELKKQARSFELAAVVASNRNVRLLSMLPEKDSDGDGVADRIEEELGLNPAKPDTDADGYRDVVELRASTELRPLEVDAGCDSGKSDRDEDGLADCEEDILGTDRDNADTDGDEIPDELEVLLDSSPTSADRSLDRDLDGIADRSETVMHLEPAAFETPELQARWGYQYDVTEKIGDGTGTGTACYVVSVKNIALAETFPTEEHPMGGQVIDLVVTFKTPDIWATERFYRNRERVAFLWPDYREPANGVIELKASDFYALPVFDLHGTQLELGHQLSDPVAEQPTGPTGNPSLEPTGTTTSGQATATGTQPLSDKELAMQGGCAATSSAPAALVVALVLVVGSGSKGGRRRRR